MAQQHLLLLIVGITLSVFCSAKYLYINPNGVDVGSCNSTNPCQTIYYALDNAANNDTLVLDGQLIGNNLVVNKSIIIVSLKEEKPAIVDCGGSRCFIFNEPNISSNINSIIIQNGNASIGGAVVISNGASPSFNSVAFRNNQASISGGAVYITDTLSHPTFKNVTFLSNQAQLSGGAIHLENGAAVEIEASTFQKCSAKTRNGFGGAISGLNSTTIIISRSLIHYNLGQSSGGAVSIVGAALEISSSIFYGNSAVNGGAIAAINDSKVIIANSNFTSHTANEYGGGLYSTDSDVTIFGCNFIVQSASNGGGVLIVGGNVDIASSFFSFNNAQYGAGIFLQGSPTRPLRTSVTDVLFSNNTASVAAAGFYLALQIGSESNLIFKNVIVTGNAASYYGSGFLIEGGEIKNRSRSVVISDSTFRENYQTRNSFNTLSGGAGYLGGGLTGVEIINTTFINNAASFGGGMFIKSKDNGLKVRSCSFISNIASSYEYNALGGGVFVDSGSGLQMQSCSFFNNTASSGGGVFTSKGAAISAFSDCKFIANRGFVFGGAMYCGGCNISRSVFTKNTASNGGAISVQEGTLYISDSNCTENIAGIGGGLSVSKSYFSASNVIFVENKATNNDTNLNSYSLGAGGGFYCVGSITTSPFGTMSFIRNSANSKLGNNYFGNGCDPISTFGCPQCESSLSNCVMDPTYGGSCTCGESNLDSQWCLTSGSMSCNGVNANDENVCSGAGECLSPDNCLCQVDRAGKNCETQRKELVVSAVGTSNCSYANPCTLDSAVRTAKAGDLIVVEDGTYVVSSSLYFPSLVNIVSRNGPKSTIIQGTAGNILFRLFTSSIGPSDYTIFSGLTFTNGTCGLYWATGSVVVQDSIFTRFNGNSEVDEYSGTIKPASNTAKLIVRRSTFLSNTQRSGAAIRSAGATVFADNVSIHNNYASAYGAESLAIAIEHKCGYQKPCGRVVISNSNIYNNSGVGPSSAIAINGGVVKMFNIKVQSNIGPGISVSIAKYDASGIISSGNGGAGIVSSSSDVTISNCTTNGNQDSGFQFWYCTGLVSDCTTYSNAGQSPGGGLEIFASSSVPAIHPLQLNNIVVFNNTAKGAGGAYCAGPVKAIVNNIQMYNNYGPNAPNLGTDNICNIWPDNCAQCSMTGSHCSASSDGCSCMPGATGPYCLLN